MFAVLPWAVEFRSQSFLSHIFFFISHAAATRTRRSSRALVLAYHFSGVRTVGFFELTIFLFDRRAGVVIDSQRRISQVNYQLTIKSMQLLDAAIYTIISLYYLYSYTTYKLIQPGPAKIMVYIVSSLE